MNYTESDTEQLLEELEAGLIWYNNNSYKSNPSELLKWQDEMAIRSYWLASMLAEANKKYNGSYFMRKITVAKKEQTLIKAGHKIGEAKAEALIQAEKQYKEEQDAEAEAVRCDILLRQVNKVLQASQQRISYEKSELERTQKNQNQP